MFEKIVKNFVLYFRGMTGTPYEPRNCLIKVKFGYWNFFIGFLGIGLNF